MLVLLLLLATATAQDVDPDTAETADPAEHVEHQCPPTEEVEKRLGEVEATLDEQIAAARELMAAIKAAHAGGENADEDAATEFVGPVPESPTDIESPPETDASTDALDAPAETEVLAVDSAGE